MSRIILTGNSDIVIYNFRFELAQRLINDGHEVYVVAPYGQRIKYLKQIGCKYIDINIDRRGTNPLKEIKLINDYANIINEVKPNIVFSYTIKPNIYCAIACRRNNIPIVINITGLGTAVENYGWKQVVTVLMYKYAFTNVQKIFFQNEENKKFFVDKKISDVSKYEILPGSGVNLNKFEVYPYPKKSEIRFAYISRVMKEKGIDLYINAAKIIRNKYPNTVFDVCGFCEEEYQDILSDLTKQGIVDYKGMIMDIREELKQVNCVIFPSYYPEGLSNVLLESCACARPLITTNRSGCKEAVDDGANGYIVKQKDLDDLVDKIEMFIKLDYKKQKQMGLNGRIKVEKQYDRNIVVDKYIKELAKIK